MQFFPFLLILALLSAKISAEYGGALFFQVNYRDPSSEAAKQAIVDMDALWKYCTVATSGVSSVISDGRVYRYGGPMTDERYDDVACNKNKRVLEILGENGTLMNYDTQKGFNSDKCLSTGIATCGGSCKSIMCKASNATIQSIIGAAAIIALALFFY